MFREGASDDPMDRFSTPEASLTPPQETDDDPMSSDVMEFNTPPPTSREAFRDIFVKIHVRRPEKDSWRYLGRGLVAYENSGQSSRVVVRSFTSRAEVAVFSSATELQAEKRGTFVILSCVQGERVLTWSFNALKNSETLRLLASVELACYRGQRLNAGPQRDIKQRRRVDRVIRDDRRRRHRRRKEQEALIDAFANQNIDETELGRNLEFSET